MSALDTFPPVKLQQLGTLVPRTGFGVAVTTTTSLALVEKQTTFVLPPMSVPPPLVISSEPTSMIVNPTLVLPVTLPKVAVKVIVPPLPALDGVNEAVSPLPLALTPQHPLALQLTVGVPTTRFVVSSGTHPLRSD